MPTDNLEKEKEVLRAQALNEGKPEKIVERMVEGRIEKYYKESLPDGTALRQGSGQDHPRSDFRSYPSPIGEKISVRRFVRFERGEGIEKRKDDFAAEIAANLEKIK